MNDNRSATPATTGPSRRHRSAGIELCEASARHADWSGAIVPSRSRAFKSRCNLLVGIFLPPAPARLRVGCARRHHGGQTRGFPCEGRMFQSTSTSPAASRISVNRHARNASCRHSCRRFEEPRGRARRSGGRDPARQRTRVEIGESLRNVDFVGHLRHRRQTGRGQPASCDLRRGEIGTLKRAPGLRQQAAFVVHTEGVNHRRALSAASRPAGDTPTDLPRPRPTCPRSSRSIARDRWNRATGILAETAGRAGV